MASLKTGLIVGVAAAGVAVAALAGGGVRLQPVMDVAGGHHLSLTRASTATIFSPPPGAPDSFADIFQKVSPAVVSIDVTTHLNEKMLKSIPGLQGLPFGVEPKGGGEDDGDDGDNNGTAPQGPKAQSSGSGFFISQDGYIVTNNHVVENAEDIKVTLKNGDILPATVVGRDEATDLAVIKVKGSGFPFVDFENSAKPRVGDWVIAIGNPFGLGNTATAGIVSAYGRDIGDSFVDFIQLDAPINRGNSGGPTFDTYGRVIGVNSAIFSPSGGSVGIGFAIPSDVADQITKELIAGGKITRGYMGASIQNVTPDVAESLGMKGRKGALVAEVVLGGPAQKAGIRSGDVVVAMNGQPVDSNTELTRLVAQSHQGDVLHVQVVRNGKPLQIDVRSGVRPSEDQLAANAGQNGEDQQSAPDAGGASHPHVLGLTLGALGESERHKLSLPSDARGALVLGVKSSSDAGDKGLQAGDLIVRAGDTDVAAPSDVQAAVAQAKQAGRSSILIGVRRGGRTSFVPIKLEG